MKNPHTASAHLQKLFARAATADYIGEPVTQEQHALQAAALATRSGDEELILAALCHDVGHLCFPDAPAMANVGILEHELLGSDYLRALGFSKRVAGLVAGHVAAKRYLVATQPGYGSKLSAASQTTLDYQGGPMSKQEVIEFEQHPDFKAMLQLRAWDEQAKEPSLPTPVPEFEAYVPMIEQHVAKQQLSASDVQAFQEQGFLHLKNYFAVDSVARIRQQVAQLEALPETPGKWMQYFEPGPGSERLLCRIENFLQYHEPFNALLNGPWLCGLVGQLMGEEAILFKEKINFKLPGASGFAAHQDAPAFTSFQQNYHITLMLSFDASTVANGCLEVVPGNWGQDYLPMAEDKTLSEETRARLNWQPLETEPGDMVLFGSFLPHRSGPNLTNKPRRALYATYNALAEGSVRDAYYAEKRRVFPPEIEREAGVDYNDAGVFNVGNPVARG
ncbi:MAG: phytanoyl-CoA dioxygenase family protein [Pseudomonadales bacterium]